MLEPTEYEIEPLMVEGRPYTGVAMRYGRAWLRVVMTDTRAATEYVHLPRGGDATPAPHPRIGPRRFGAHCPLRRTDPND